VGHHKVLNLSTSLVPHGCEERLFSKTQLSFLFIIRSTMAKGMLLFPLGWRTQVSLYMGPVNRQVQPKGDSTQVR